MRTLVVLLLAVASAVAAPQQSEQPALRLVIVGDSTVCNYPDSSLCRGWGQFIEGFFRKDTVRVYNIAKSGRSTKTFLKEGLWKRALDEKPDIVLIQFGHNDSHGSGRPEATDAATDYKDYLRRYIDESRAIGAVPILVTPMHRRTFGRDGKLTDILGPYAAAMKEIASEKKAPLIDLHAASGKLFEQLGDAGSAAFANAPGDRTHFNEKGARAMAELVMSELPQAEPRLKALLAATSAANLVEVRKLWDEARHNAFTDLTRFNGLWFCVFREGTGHVSPDGAVRVLTSEDGARWESAARLEWAGHDLRDPKITSTPDGKRLMLLGGAAVREGSQPAALSLSFTTFSSDGRDWSQLQTAGETNRWLWRVTCHNGKAYGVDYDVAPAVRTGRKYTTALVASDDGAKFTTLVPRLYPQPGTTEATLRFDADGTVLCLQRRDGTPNTALFGRSAPPYTTWQWYDLGAYFGGPNFLQLPTGAWVACGRMFVTENGKRVPKTVLCSLNVTQPALTPLLTLPSGGDCSYPGLVWHDGLLWISYYSSHEGRSAIYLAKVKIQ